MTEQKTGPELLDEAAQHPTLDELMRRDPKDLTEDDYRVLIEHQRHDRAMFISAQAKKQDKKSGVEETDDE